MCMYVCILLSLLMDKCVCVCVSMYVCVLCVCECVCGVSVCMDRSMNGVEEASSSLRMQALIQL